MEIAINSGSLSYNTPAAVAQAKSLGFTALEINLQQDELHYDFNRQPNLAFYEALAQEIELRGMRIVSVHNLFLNAEQVFSQQVRCEILVLAGRLAARLGAGILVAHPADLFTSEEDLTCYLYNEQGARKPPLIAGFDQVRAELDELQVSLALENINHWHDTLLTNQAESMHRLTNALDCLVALDARRCIDRPNLERWVELMGERIVSLYVQDRVKGREQHPPLDPAWRQHIKLLRHTEAQVCIIKAHATPLAQGNIRASRDYITRVWQSELAQANS